MTGREYLALILSTALSAIGLIMSFHFGKGEWFARSGSLITCVAVIFASLQLRSQLATIPSFLDSQLNTHRAEILSAFGDPTEAERHLREVSDAVRTEVAAAARTADKRLYWIELSLFVVGTLIWGYGDVPLNAILG
ncbi:membrane hypothetical protein [Cupriavidus taiwanensis]|nr:membrane hypothetical protein [Cupriavidus taiwanensis]